MDKALSHPRAWVFAASFWGSRESVPDRLRDEAEPLYDQKAIDAAVAAERERCARLCEQADKSTHPADLADAIRGA